jgi:hypothetical protein
LGRLTFARSDCGEFSLKILKIRKASENFIEMQIFENEVSDIVGARRRKMTIEKPRTLRGDHRSSTLAMWLVSPRQK